MGLELLEAVQGIQPGVQRQRRAVAAEFVAVQEGCVFFLQVAAVGQQDGAQVAGAPRGMDVAVVAVAGEQGQVAAVVQVGVGENHRIDLVGRQGQWLPVAKAQLLVALEQPAIHQHAFAVVAHQVLRPGHGAGSAQKGDAHAHVCFSRCCKPPWYALRRWLSAGPLLSPWGVLMVINDGTWDWRFVLAGDA